MKNKTFKIIGVALGLILTLGLLGVIVNSFGLLADVVLPIPSVSDSTTEDSSSDSSDQPIPSVSDSTTEDSSSDSSDQPILNHFLYDDLGEISDSNGKKYLTTETTRMNAIRIKDGGISSHTEVNFHLVEFIDSTTYRVIENNFFPALIFGYGVYEYSGGSGYLMPENVIISVGSGVSKVFEISVYCENGMTGGYWSRYYD